MEPQQPRRGLEIAQPARAGDRLDRLFALTIAGCAALTLLVLEPGIRGHAVLPTVDLALDTISLVIFVALVALTWARFRESRVIVAIYHAAAFQALAVAYGFAVLISLQHSESIGRLEQPENVQVLVFSVAHLAAAILFVIAGAFTARRSYGWSPVWILVAPTLAVLLAALIGTWLNPPPDPLQIIIVTDASGLPHVTPFGFLVHIATACLLFVGAFVSRALWRSGRAVFDGWIAIGLVFAAFGELNWILYPSAHPGQVSTGDLFQLAFSLSLLIGLEAAVRSGLRELRAANIELGELRDVEVERASLEERSRLARELHDGLAQDLWLAKLRTGELAAMPDLSDAARRVAQEAVAAVDVGLGDAREAVAALRSPTHAESGFCDRVRRTVDDCADRFGMRVEFTFDGDHTTRIAPRTQAEVLRIVQESLTNVARHADASVVGVRLAIRRERISLRIVDSGRGFDTADIRPDSFGLVSMRERASLIGGRLRIVSRAGEGTCVILSAPFTRSAALVEGEHP